MRLPGVAAMIAAPAALLLTPGRAEAILTYNIFDSGPNQVTLQASGSISLVNAISAPNINCGTSPGLIQTNFVLFCTGPNQSIPGYEVTGTNSLSITPGFATGTSGSLISTVIDGGFQEFAISSNYVSGTTFTSSSIFNGVTLASLGFTTPGLIASWQLVGVSGPAGQIDLVVGAPAASVPGPLPLLGAGTAFAFTRRLRRRSKARLNLG